MLQILENPTMMDIFVVFMWIGFIVLLVLKQEWFFRFEQRMPRMDVFDRMVYQGFNQILFMGIRLVVLVVILYVVGAFLRLFGA